MQEYETSGASREKPKLLDSIFELFKGARDQKGHPIYFGLYEDNGIIRERNNTDSAFIWWEQLCCEEIRDLYRKDRIDYSNNHAYTGFVNQKKNKANEAMYLKYLRPALCSEHGGIFIGDEHRHMLNLLDQGVAMAQYFSDPDPSWEPPTKEEARRHIKFVARETPENRKKAVFGYDGMCSRFCRWELDRKGRATGSRGEKNEGESGKTKSHKKKTGEVVPGPYRVLGEHYPWFVKRVSRGFLTRCTDEKIFFQVVAAAFVLGLNLDDKQDNGSAGPSSLDNKQDIDSTVRNYLDACISNEDDILCFESTLSRFCSETRIAALPDYPPKLNRMLSAVMRGGWDENNLRKSIRGWQKNEETALDVLRNQYLEWMLVRVEFEILNKELYQLLHNGGISVQLDAKQEQLVECKAEIDRLKTAADQRLDKMIAQEQAAADTGREISGLDSYTISFDGGWANVR